MKWDIADAPRPIDLPDYGAMYDAIAAGRKTGKGIRVLLGGRSRGGLMNQLRQRHREALAQIRDNYRVASQVDGGTVIVWLEKEIVR